MLHKNVEQENQHGEENPGLLVQKDPGRKKVAYFRALTRVVTKGDYLKR